MNYGQHPGWIEVDLRRDVQRQERGADPPGAAGDHRAAAGAGVQVAPGRPVRRAVQRLQPRRHRAGGDAGGLGGGDLPAGRGPGSQLVAIDEAQFLDPDIVSVATLLAGRGVRVVLAGTDTDFRGEPFGPMGELMAVAEMVDKLQAICVVCGDPACRNQRLIDGKPARYDSPTIMVGGRESYEARCRHCHKVPQGRTRIRRGCCLAGLADQPTGVPNAAEPHAGSARGQPGPVRC